MSNVKSILDTKGREVYTIAASASVYQAIERLAEKEIGALPVIDDKNQLVGIVSERDYARKVILKDKSSKSTSVSEIMTSDVITVSEDTSINKCKALMTVNKIRHLPVMHQGEMSGILSVDDVLRFLIKDQKEFIEELESYIMDETGGEG